MKKIQYVKLVGLLTILLFLNISCKDDDTLLRGSGITEQSWSTNQTYFASAEQTLTFTFTTLSSWTAQNSSTALLSLGQYRRKFRGKYHKSYSTQVFPGTGHHYD